MKRVRESSRAARLFLDEVFRLGDTGLSGPSLWRTGRLLLAGLIVGTNLVGLVAVVTIAMFVVPMPELADLAHVRLVNVLVATVYFLVVAPLAAVIGIRGVSDVGRWLVEQRAPSNREQAAVLLAPFRLFVLQTVMWLMAAVLFGVLNLSYSNTLAVRAAIIVVVVGVSTASCAYLFIERALRPVAVRAFKHAVPPHVKVPGVATRAVLAWAVGSGPSLLALVAIGTLVLTGDPATRSEIGISMVTLGGTGLAVGMIAVTLAARATADPLSSVRRGLADVRRGEFAAQVPVYDGTQIGLLQHGFNEMAAGLAEREQIRDAFGTYVDPDVAARILEHGTKLEGEELEVTMMFVDIRDFTGFAERTTPAEVVAAINRLFERIVPLIHAHGGRVDKFIGDGLLAVFGAPRRQQDHPDQALASALEIDSAINLSLASNSSPTSNSSRAIDHSTDTDQDACSELSIGIGLNSGTVVAGNVGGAGRLEFSVIGDAVNTAARVESATRKTGDTILLTERTKQLLSSPQLELTEREEIPLKGKTGTARLYTPRPCTGTGPTDAGDEGAAMQGEVL